MDDNLLLSRELDFKSDEDIDPTAKRFSYEIVVYNKWVRDNLKFPFPKKLRWSDAWANNHYFLVRNTVLPEETVRKLAKARFPEHQGFVVVDVYRLLESV